jgi:acetyl-CoA carboxylase biotin carboxyl carrier protein
MAANDPERRRSAIAARHGDGMEVRELKTLLVLMRDYGLVELEIEDKKGKVRLVRGGGRASLDQTESGSDAHIVEATAEEGSQAAGKIDLAPNQKLIESPMVGTFYRAASPDAAPFVEEGSSVRKGQPLCIIEAMKMMNEIESPAAGRVIRILAENGNPIEYGQPLMIIEVI